MTTYHTEFLLRTVPIHNAKYCKTEGYYLLGSISFATTCHLVYCMNCSPFSSLLTHPHARTHKHTHTNRYFWNSKHQCLHNQQEMQQNRSMFHLKPYKTGNVPIMQQRSTFTKTVTISYSGCESIACKAHVPYHIVICCLPVSLYYIFPHYIINGTIFVEGGCGGGAEVSEHKMFLFFFFHFLYKFCLKHFSFYEQLSDIFPSMYTGLHE